MEQDDVAHNFVTTTFTTPTFCKVCKKLLWGLKAQGKRCKPCGTAVHPKCASKYSQECESRTPQELRLSTSGDLDEPTCAHAYRLHTWTKPSFCQVCDQFLWGAFKQGLRCDYCHCRTHRKCLKAARRLPCCSEKAEEKIISGISEHVELDNSMIVSLQELGHSGGESVMSMYTLMDAGLPITLESVLSVLENRRKRGGM